MSLNSIGSILNQTLRYSFFAESWALIRAKHSICPLVELSWNPTIRQQLPTSLQVKLRRLLARLFERIKKKNYKISIFKSGYRIKRNSKVLFCAKQIYFNEGTKEKSMKQWKCKTSELLQSFLECSEPRDATSMNFDVNGLNAMDFYQWRLSNRKEALYITQWAENSKKSGNFFC